MHKMGKRSDGKKVVWQNPERSGINFHRKSEDSEMIEDKTAKMGRKKRKELEPAGKTGEPENPGQLLIKASETDNY